MGDDEGIVKEKDAIEAGLALLGAKWDGDDDFSKGMRLIQEKIKEKKGKK